MRNLTNNFLNNGKIKVLIYLKNGFTTFKAFIFTSKLVL